MRRWSLYVAMAVTAGVASPLLVAGTATAANGDITAAVLAGRDVTLNGDAVVTVPPGTHTYAGVISGQGTLRITGTGTLVLTKDSTFTLPRAEQHQKLTIAGGSYKWTTLASPDAPAITVDKGATLQYGDGNGSAGVIGVYPYSTPGYALNQDNIEVNGTLRLAIKNRVINIGTFSGSGVIAQPRNLWPGPDMSGANTDFRGTIENGTEMSLGKPYYSFAIPHARPIWNLGSAIIGSPNSGEPTVIRQDFYENHWGNDVNVHGTVVLAGQYSYSDRGTPENPSLSDPSLNWKPAPHGSNVRGTNIEGAHVTWGDGTTHRIFMPGTAQTMYINLHADRSGHRGSFAFDYDGPVTLGAPIGGGIYHDTLKTPGAGDIIIKGTRGNDVTFAAAQFYDGSTTIQKNAVLRLGSGSSGGDGSLYAKGGLDKVVDNGALVVRNTRTATTLPPLSGRGSLTQSGPATTTLTGARYTGSTTVTGGTLAVSGTTLAASSGVTMTSARAILDLTRAPVKDGTIGLAGLDVAKGATIRLPKAARSLTVGAGSGRLSGGRTTVGGASFAVTRTADATVLTATRTTAGATAAHATAATAADTPAPQTGSAASPAAVTGRLAETGGDGFGGWTALGLAAFSFAAAAGASAFSRSRRNRRGTVRRARHGA